MRLLSSTTWPSPKDSHLDVSTSYREVRDQEASGDPLTKVKLDPGRPRAGAVQRNQRWGLYFVLPILVFFVFLRFVPIIYAIGLSFFHADGLSTPRFIGFANYITLAHDSLFLQALGATAYYVVGTCVPLWGLSLLLALMLNRPMRGIGVFRIAFYLPAVIPTVVVPILWRFLYHPYGLINSILESVRVPGVDWLGSTQAVIPAFIVTSEWRFIPIFMIIFLAGLQGIPREVEEAAVIDGASALQRFFNITLPLLTPTTLVVIIVSVIVTAKSLPLALLMTGGGPGGASRLLSLFVYENGFEFYKLGYASAASMVLLALLGAFTLLLLRLNRSQEA